MIHEIQFCSLFDHDFSSFIYWLCNFICDSEISFMTAFENEIEKNRSILKWSEELQKWQLREALLIAFAFSCINNKWYTHLSSFFKSLSTSYLLSVVIHADCLLLKIRVIVYSVIIKNVLQQRYVKWEELSWDD